MRATFTNFGVPDEFLRHAIHDRILSLLIGVFGPERDAAEWE
jgi:hypothetical protein